MFLVYSTPQISRNDVSLFLSLTPQIPRRPIPQPVLDLLVTKRPDWGSNNHLHPGIAEATRRVYQSGWRHYASFCTKFGFSPLPLTEYTLCQFAATLAESVGQGTIRSYLSALRFAQINMGFPDPSFSSFPRLFYLLKGIRRSIPNSLRAKRLPITPNILKTMHIVWSSTQ